MKSENKQTVNVSFNLGFVAFELEDILSVFGGKEEIVGPFLIISRKNGLAIESAEEAEQECRPFLNNPHGRISQQWLIKRVSPKSKEIVILSAVNGMALDRTPRSHDGAPLILYGENSLAWQRWKLQKTPDKFGWIIQSIHDSRVLDVGRTPSVNDEIWMWTIHELEHQQFLILTIGKNRATIS